jgi:ABC-2 type transport system permease protein
MSAPIAANERESYTPARLAARFVAFFRATRVILTKDLRVLMRQPVNIAATLVPPIAFLLVNALGAVAIGRNPVALVTLDQG